MTEISKNRLVELENMEAKLLALESGGVDNWEGYDFAMYPVNARKELQTLIFNCVEDISAIVYRHGGTDCGYSLDPDKLDDIAKGIKKFAIEYNNIKNQKS